ncbi:MAG: CHASE domain-containing protein [Planctomycetota bacterium]
MNTDPQRLRTGLRDQWRAALWTALAYFVAGRLALLLAIPPGYAAAVWPASGIALASVLMRGFGVLPGVWIGSFLVNLGTSFDGAAAGPALATTAIAASIGAGATLQAALAGWLVQRRVGYPTALQGEGDAARFLVLGGLIGCLVSPTVGVSTLVLTGAVQGVDVAFSWLTWWVGDAIGSFTFGPLVLMACGEPRRAWRGLRLAVGAPLLTAVAVAVVAFVFASDLEMRALRVQFEQRANGLTEAIGRQVEQVCNDVRGLGALFGASDHVEPAEFGVFARHILDRRGDLQVLSWVPRVTRTALESFESAQRSRFERFEVVELGEDGVRPASEREEYWPVTYLEPLAGNERAVAFDIGADPTRRAAIDRAVTTGEPCLSAAIELVQGPQPEPGVLVVSPLFAHDRLPPSIGERRQRAAGVITAAVVIADWLGPLVRDIDPRQLALVVRDAADRETRLFGVGVPSPEPVFALSRSLAAGGRAWTVDVSASRDYLVAQRPLQAWSTLLGCMLFSGLLGLVLLAAAGRTAQVEERVHQRTAELREAHDQLARRIEEQRDIERRLRLSQSELEEAQARARIGSWELDPKTHTGSWSTFMFELLGRNPADGLPPFDEFLALHVHPEDQAALLDVHSWVLQNETSAELTWRTMPDTAGATHVSTRVACVRDPDSGRLRMVGTLQDVSERKAAEEELLRGLREKEVMVQEIHHRVKNNLQIVMSMLSMQQRRAADPRLREVLRDCQDRIHAMAQIHETLYRAADLTSIDLRSHVDDLCRRLIASHGLGGDRLRLELDVPPCALTLDQAVPLSLLLNELVANACKHAFAGGRSGTLRVTVRASKGRVTALSVADDGVGLPADFDLTDNRTLGMHLIAALARQLGWTVEVETAPPWTCFRITMADVVQDRGAAADVTPVGS